MKLCKNAGYFLQHKIYDHIWKIKDHKICEHKQKNL